MFLLARLENPGGSRSMRSYALFEKPRAIKRTNVFVRSWETARICETMRFSARFDNMNPIFGMTFLLRTRRRRLLYFTHV